MGSINEGQKNKQEQSQAPAPYTVVQTLAARLRQIHAAQADPIELVAPIHTTKQGQLAVIYNMDDYMNKLAVDCKYTLIGKFTATMPKVELIRKSFILQTQLNGGVNIAHYNAKHVFIDLENELDYNTVWSQQRMTIEGKLMRIQAWTPNFKPEEETPIVPIWVLLPRLPWHCFKKEFITPLLASVGKVLYLNTASIKRTRASMAKVKVQIDLTKARPRHVWIGLDDEDLTIGRWQTIEYENIPLYCDYCRHQGHMMEECNFRIRDEDFRKRKEGEADKITKNKEEQVQPENNNNQNSTKEQEKWHNNNKNEGNNQQQSEQQKEEAWQVQKRRNNKQQEDRIQKAVWRPIPSQNRHTKEQQTGMGNNSNKNVLLTYTCRKDKMKTGRNPLTLRKLHHNQHKITKTEYKNRQRRSNRKTTMLIGRAQVLTLCSLPLLPPNLFLMLIVVLRKLLEGWMGEVRRTILKCRKGCPKGGLYLMLCLKETLLTLVLTLEPLLPLQVHNIKQRDNKISTMNS
ncbi:hypothetical protein R3W88_022604 [Solanum pinnatisectum]|uniref:DUF4283 domain-containing protein n=1 Tax=Solanum pinnatisectum TaxID=50273 RepID=A0AAV9LV58_9SOLN|nr:hypothetical protein R3W88_022604 [Solanum pinnatisectum]